MEKFGFVYIWRDKKHGRYYVGSHWGTEDDGYVCSSMWMRKSRKRRPHDFKRRIVARVYTTRTDLLEEEQRWLAMIKPGEIKTRYYNLRLKTGTGYWWAKDSPEVLAKISETSKDRKWTAEQKAKLKGRPAWNKGMKGQYTLSIREDDPRRGKPSWNSGTAAVKVLKGRKGRTVSEETREKIRAAKTGTVHSEETRAKISASKTGSIPWNKGKKGVSEETRTKMRAAALNRNAA